MFHLGLELEFGFIYLFIFVVGPTKLLLAPRIVQQCMRNLKFKLKSHFGLELKLGVFYFFFVVGTIDLLSSPKVVWECMKNPNSTQENQNTLNP